MAVIRERKMEENRQKVQAVLVECLQQLHKKHIPSSTARYNTAHGVEKYNRDIEQIELMFRKEMKEYDLDEVCFYKHFILHFKVQTYILV